MIYKNFSYLLYINDANIASRTSILHHYEYMTTWRLHKKVNNEILLYK